MSYESAPQYEPWPEEHLEMHICPSSDCECQMMQTQTEQWVLVRGEDDSVNWWAPMWCASCETSFEGIFSEAQAEAYDEAMDEFIDAMHKELQRIEQEGYGKVILQ